MADIASLEGLREDRFFAGWEEFISPDRVAASEASIRILIDDLLALSPKRTEAATRAAVRECICRFNGLNDSGWICTIEREDIYEQIGQIIDRCGFDYDEDWISERNW